MLSANVNYERHEESSLFGSIPEEELESLKSSIKSNGVIDNEILVFEGKIIDGWHRYSIAKELGILDVLEFIEVDSEASQISFTKNMNRRHLTASQRGMIVVERHNWASAGGDRVTEEGKARTAKAKTNKQLASLAGVGQQTILDAKNVSKLGRSQDVIDGKITINQVLIDEGKKKPPPIAPEIVKEHVEQQLEQGKLDISEIVVPDEQKEKVFNEVRKQRLADKREKEEKEKKEQAKQESQNTAVAEETHEEKYDILYFNPPWAMESNDYNGISDNVVIDWSVGLYGMAKDDAIFFCWVDTKNLPKMFGKTGVLARFKFMYYDAWVWDKQVGEQSHLLNRRHEYLIIAARGSVKPPSKEHISDSVYSEAHDGSLNKPEYFMDWITKCYPDSSKAAVFFSGERDGWTMLYSGYTEEVQGVIDESENLSDYEPDEFEDADEPEGLADHETDEPEGLADETSDEPEVLADTDD